MVVALDLFGQRRVHFRHFACFAGNTVAEDHRTDTTLLKVRARHGQTGVSRSDDMIFHTCKHSVARLRRFGDLAASTVGQMAGDGEWWRDAIGVQYIERLLVRRNVRHSRPGSDGGRIVTGNVGNNQRYHFRLCHCRQAAALYER